MNNEQFIDYLKQFNSKDAISFIVGNPSKDVRKVYPTKNVICITDMENPCIFIEVDKGKNMDDENLKHTNSDDQISIDDFIGGDYNG